MDRNDVLKAKKAAVDELAELATSGENTERMVELKDEIRAFDARLEAFDMAADAGKGKFTPDIQKQDKPIIEIGGGPVTDRSYAGMFNQGRALEVTDELLRGFRTAMLEGLDVSGGYSVPEPLAAAWLDDNIESEIIRPRAAVWPMDSATRKVAGWDAADQTGGILFGGFAMEFLAEAAEGTPQTGKLRVIELAAKKGAIFVDISNELREDGQGFEGQLDRAMRTSIGYGMDHYFINGNAAAQPRGILEDPALISVAKETGQTKKTITWLNIAKMYARIYPAGRQRAVWLANSDTLPELMGLTIGTDSAYSPVLTESNGQFYMLGRPVLFNSHMPVLGQANDIMLVDLSQYAVGIRRGLTLEKSIIPGWTRDLTSFRALLRFDGMGTWNEPITLKNGNTLSWAVGLAERA